MRDIDRIDKVTARLAELWKTVPDWRLMQLIDNLQRWIGNDMFYYEDDRFIDVLEKFLGGN